ncbi:MAG: putative methyltransferase [Candidatus Saccharibacteria bacterium]|nr:putative methyltransferase [Candidatus Saccharibacteria bacterium]
MKQFDPVTVTLSRIIGGGQAIGTGADGKKVLTWGGLPGETVEVAVSKKKSNYLEGTVTNVQTPSKERVEPRDPDSYLSTSPWQIMAFEAEQHYKAALIEEAFEQHDIVLPNPIEVFTDGNQYEYRNKIEYSFWFDTETEKLSLAFFRRGTHGKIAIDQMSLASPAITVMSKVIVSVLNGLKIGGRDLKTLLIRSNAQGEVTWQLYVKEESINADEILAAIESVQPSICGEVIYSNPQSPASVITKRLASSSELTLSDTILDIPFRYATEGFFQINLPVYEQALRDMKQWIIAGTPVVDLYSGVGTIGLTIGGDDLTLIELSKHAVHEMKRNIYELGRKDTVKAVLAASEDAVEYITSDATIIVDPPRAGLHEDVIDRLLETKPARIIYLSCNPATQARDVMRLASVYGINHHQGYNFFPRTPHIEHLVILDVKP